MNNRNPIIWERVKGRGYRQLAECETVSEAERAVAFFRECGRDAIWSRECPKEIV